MRRAPPDSKTPILHGAQVEDGDLGVRIQGRLVRASCRIHVVEQPLNVRVLRCTPHPRCEICRPGGRGPRCPNPALCNTTCGTAMHGARMKHWAAWRIRWAMVRSSCANRPLCSNTLAKWLLHKRMRVPRSSRGRPVRDAPPSALPHVRASDADLHPEVLRRCRTCGPVEEHQALVRAAARFSCGGRQTHVRSCKRSAAPSLGDRMGLRELARQPRGGERQVESEH